MYVCHNYFHTKKKIFQFYFSNLVTNELLPQTLERNTLWIILSGAIVLLNINANFFPVLNTVLLRHCIFHLQHCTYRVQCSFLALCIYTIFKYQKCPVIYYSSSMLKMSWNLLQIWILLFFGFCCCFCCCLFFGGTQLNLCSGDPNRPLQWGVQRKYHQIEELHYQKVPRHSSHHASELWYSLVMMGVSVYPVFSTD